MKHTLHQMEAQKVAIEGLAFIATQPDLLARFLALSGIEAQDIRQAAASEGFLAAVLSFLCANEVDLLAFCRHSHYRPETVSLAVQSLSGDYQEENL